MFNRTPPKSTLRQEHSISDPDLASRQSKDIKDLNVTLRKRKRSECMHDAIIKDIKDDLHKTSSKQEEMREMLADIKKLLR